MSRKVVFSTLLLGALVVASIVGVVAYRSANAAAPVTAISAQNGPGRGGPGQGAGGYTDEGLATALGISVDELQAAYKTANAAALAQAVKDGLITQAQADELTEKDSAFPFGNRWDNWLSQNGVDFDALLADALGITEEELQTARTQAYNAQIDQAVTDGKLTQEQADLVKGQRALYANQDFQDAMQTAFEAAVKKAVEAGVITQAQADQILSNAAGSGRNGFPGMGGQPGPGGPEGGPRGGYEGGPRGMGSKPGSSTDTSAATTPEAYP